MKSVIEILKKSARNFDFAASGDFIADGNAGFIRRVTLGCGAGQNFNISIQGTDIVPENLKLETIHALLHKAGKAMNFKFRHKRITASLP